MPNQSLRETSMRSSTRSRHLCTILIAVASLFSASAMRAQIPSYLLNYVYSWGPVVFAEVDNQICHRCYDHLLPVDFDGDWDATNNSANSWSQSSLPDTRATVY